MHHPENGTLDDARYFVAVAEDLSFARAARRLRTPTSTLSRRIAAFEAAYGVRLLQRTSRKVGLTNDGMRLLERLRPLITDLTSALENTADGEPTGRLVVTAPLVTGTNIVGPALTAFAKAHPRVIVELRLTNAVLDVIGEGIDLAFRERPVADQDLVARKLWTFEYALFASRDFAERELGTTTISQERLLQTECIVLKAGRTWSMRTTKGRAVSVVGKERFVVDDPRVAVAVAAEGLGLAYVMRVIAERHPELVEVRVKGLKPAPRTIYAVYPSRKLLASRVRLALDWIARHDVLPELRAWDKRAETTRRP